MSNLWGLQWYSKNKLNGETRHLILCIENHVPVLFRTRKLARLYAQNRYGFIKNRKDLRNEPHGWRFPQPIKVQVTIKNNDNE
jgi:hypothetical protein